MTEPQPSIDEQIGKRLRRLRQRLGDRQIDFATRIGRERSTVAKYERGQRSLSLADIVHIAERLQRSPQSVLLELISDTPALTGLDTLLMALARYPELLPELLQYVHTSLQHPPSRRPIPALQEETSAEELPW